MAHSQGLADEAPVPQQGMPAVEKEPFVEVEDVVGRKNPDGQTEVQWTENTPEEKKLVRKIDMWLMPTIWILYMFSYMVRRPCPGPLSCIEDFHWNTN